MSQLYSFINNVKFPLLFSTKADLEEIDNLTSEVWRLKSKLRNFERTEKKKQEKLLEIEDQKTVLYKRVRDVEEKVIYSHPIFLSFFCILLVIINLKHSLFNFK